MRAKLKAEINTLTKIIESMGREIASMGYYQAEIVDLREQLLAEVNREDFTRSSMCKLIRAELYPHIATPPNTEWEGDVARAGYRIKQIAYLGFDCTDQNPNHKQERELAHVES